MDDGDAPAARRVDDGVAANVGVPDRLVRQRLVLDAEHLGSDREQAVEDPLQWEVGGHLVVVDAELGAAQLGVVVAQVPRLEVVVALVGGEPACHHGDLVRRLLRQRRHELLVEPVDRLGVVGHLLVHRVMGPRRPPEQLGDPLAPRHGLGQQLAVRVGGTVVEEAGELLSTRPAARLVEERHDVGVRHRDAVATVVVASEAGAVLVGEPGEVLVIDDHRVGDVGDVLVEAHADLDQAGHRRRAPPRGPRERDRARRGGHRAR